MVAMCYLWDATAVSNPQMCVTGPTPVSAWSHGHTRHKGSCPLSQLCSPALYQLSLGGVFSIPHCQGRSGLTTGLWATGSTGALTRDMLQHRVNLQQAG